jgi:2-iminobutanoate/2-iminopropanoate deaminase
VQRERIARPVGPFSPAARYQPVVYVSVHVGEDPLRGRLISRGVVEQTERALEKIRAVLEAAGGSLQDVLGVGICLTHMEDFAAVNQAYATHFAHPFSAGTTIAVADLPLGTIVEIAAVAADSSCPANGLADAN